MTILLTGATGYIGSHIWVELLQRSYEVVGIDDFSNSSIEVCNDIEKISDKKIAFAKGDVRDGNFLSEIFKKHSITHVIHLAALKDVQESLLNRGEYFDVNVNGLKTLLAVMRANDCRKIIFSSSAAVYGQHAISPILEGTNPSPASYYGETKLEGERLLAEEFNKDPVMSSASLRYFNVAGKHASGFLRGRESSNAHSLFSEIEDVLLGKKYALPIFGDDWGTPDGTCIRDYLHISDLVQGHINAIKLLNGDDKCVTLNLGLGVGQSVYEVISAYERIIGAPIPKFVTARRVGDVGVSFSDNHLATQLLDWMPQNTLFDMCRDSYRSCAN